ncbi:hypothetical protein ACFL6Y_05270 [Elusimicrobiota bacterium]
MMQVALKDQSKLHNDPIIRDYAKTIIMERFSKSDEGEIKITYADIFRLRGNASALACQHEDSEIHCVASFTDALGYGLLDTIAGKVVLGIGFTVVSFTSGGAALLVASLASSAAFTQETVQCDPDGLMMALEAGMAITFLIPWCKVPGPKYLCAKGGEAAKAGLRRVLRKWLGDKADDITVQVVRQADDGVKVQVSKHTRAKPRPPSKPPTQFHKDAYKVFTSNDPAKAKAFFSKMDIDLTDEAGNVVRKFDSVTELGAYLKNPNLFLNSGERIVIRDISGEVLQIVDHLGNVIQVAK